MDSREFALLALSRQWPYERVCAHLLIDHPHHTVKLIDAHDLWSVPGQSPDYHFHRSLSDQRGFMSGKASTV